ncbi:lachesin-like [Physella acuta]|uniref:lachesin-like n=1 Tax=Physella acuta TaxID=109671 RepID=UPI0027DB57E3|nr:lachesin-like [Physella acuta]
MGPIHYFIFLVCFTALKVYADDPKVSISETDPPTNAIYKMIVQEQDKDVQMSCVVENKPVDVEVQWTYQTYGANATLIQIATGTRSYDAFRWALDKPTPTAWRLRLQNAQVTDEGLYTCKVQVGQNNYVWDQKELKVVKKPLISDLDTSNDMTKNEEDTAKLECYANGIPKPIIKWRRMAGELLPNGGTEFQGNILSITRIEADHAGIYRCTAENSAGIDYREIRISVNFRPEVVSGTPVAKQAIGYTKELICDIKGYPPPSPEGISWSKENRPVLNGGRYDIRNIPGASNRITSILVIKSVQQSDYGLYVCKAENDKGSRQVSMELQASKEPTPTRGGYFSGGSTLSLNIATVLMLITVVLLHHVQLLR